MQMSNEMNSWEKAGNARHFVCPVEEKSGNHTTARKIRNNILYRDYHYNFVFIPFRNSGSTVNSAHCCAGCNSSRDVQISNQLSLFYFLVMLILSGVALSSRRLSFQATFAKIFHGNSQLLLDAESAMTSAKTPH